MNIPSDVSYIINKLIKSGFRAYIVGGCVRDSLMQKKPNDWDITTEATPAQVKQLFSHTYDTGIKHGTVTVLHKSEQVEVTTFRTESDYIDYRHPSKVSFTKNIYEDLKRRDFTINAIAYNYAEGYIDPHNGIKDIRDKIIRGVGDPTERFNEDALRMLRAIRFSAQLSFVIEQETYNAILKCSELITNISAERIAEELSKTLISNNPEKIFLFEELALLKHILPEISLKQNRAEINEQLNISFNQLPLRLFTLFRRTDAATAINAMKRLKLENKVINDVKFLYKHRDIKIVPDRTEIKKLLSEIGEENLRKILHLKTVLANSIEPTELRLAILNDIYESELKIQDIINSNECFCLKNLAVNGDDLKTIGISGPAVGSALHHLLSTVIQDNSHNTHERLMEIASSFI